jgi:nitrite reductase/ring-hydroxylating ferredoxin subunit
MGKMISVLKEEEVDGTIEYVGLCEVDDLWNGEMESFDVGEHEILLLKINDEFRAYDGICPHQSVSLVEGELTDQGVLICRAHQC